MVDICRIKPFVLFPFGQRCFIKDNLILCKTKISGKYSIKAIFRKCLGIRSLTVLLKKIYRTKFLGSAHHVISMCHNCDKVFFNFDQLCTMYLHVKKVQHLSIVTYTYCKLHTKEYVF